ncbi:MAG: substrate-binding domain-containing protein [Thermosynechococcaceae cyanobacterium]
MLYKHSLTFVWAVLIASAPFVGKAVVFAQAITTLPAGTQLKISDSSQMAPINQALMQRFQAQSPDVQVTLKAGEAVAGLEAVLAGQTDLVSISRPLTEDERRQGLVQVPVTREKIAIVVGKDNPFQKSLTIDLVNKITAGEITNWEKVGGALGPIRMVQRSPTSNAAQALQRYPQLRTTLAGQTNDQPVEIDGLATALGKDGVSFALISELADHPDIRALPMYGNLPTDERYPFSQPFTYVYKKDANAAVQAFLGFVAGAEGQQAVGDAIASPQSFPVQAAATPPSDSQPTASQPPVTAAPTPLLEEAPEAAGAETQPNGLEEIDWLPVVLVALGLGVLAIAVIKATAARKKQASIPKPAPNYSERVKTELPAPEHPAGTEDVVAVLDPEPLPIEPPEEGRRREHIVPEFAEFNTQMQAASTQLQGAEETVSTAEAADSAATQLQVSDSGEDAMQTRLQVTPEGTTDSSRTQLQMPEDPDASQRQRQDDEWSDRSTEVQDPSMTRLQEPEDRG